MSENSENFMIGDIVISPQHNTMSRGEQSCRLQPKVMALLHYLHKNSERVIGNDELLEQVWDGRVVTHNSIQKSINALRAAFAEFEASREYVVYFSKRGYQLVDSTNKPKSKYVLIEKLLPRPAVLFALAGVMLTLLYFAYLVVSSLVINQASTRALVSSPFTQVKPYVSNTGRERIIEPYTSSERVAFVRDEPGQEGVTESRLYIQGKSGLEWQMSVARGQFVDLAWSASGRNVVAVDVHANNGETLGIDDANSALEYYTLHIFTLDFKGEKLIEKNLLSHWLGKVDSVAWWDEGTLEFVASQGAGAESARYRYSIAEQNLTELDLPQRQGQLLASTLFNKQVAELRALNSGVQIQFFDEQQQTIGQGIFPWHIVSMSWMSDASGVLVLSDDGQLVVVASDGSFAQLNYAPKLAGRILRARSSDKGKSLVLTVQPSSIAQQPLLQTSQYKSPTEGGALTQGFLTKGGGFIYTAMPTK